MAKIKPINLMSALGFEQPSETEQSLARLGGQAESLGTRLSHIGIDPTPPKPKSSALFKALQALNIPGAAVRSILSEGLDYEPGVDWRRAFSKERLWDKPVESQDLLEQMGIAPQSKLGRGVANFAGNVLTDPLTWTTGGIASGLKVGVPFAKGTAVTSRGLAQVAGIPQAWNLLTKGTSTTIPGATAQQVAQAARQAHNLTDSQYDELLKKLTEGVKTARSRAPKTTPLRDSVIGVGSEVRPADRNNLGVVTSIDQEGNRATVSFFNRQKKTSATKEFSIDDLRNRYGNRVSLSQTRPATVAAPPPAKAESLVDRLALGLRKEIRPEQTVTTPGPLKPVADALGNMLVPGYGKNPQLYADRLKLARGITKETETLYQNLVEIFKRHGLNVDDTATLTRMAEDPAFRQMAMDGGVGQNIVKAFEEVEALKSGVITRPEVARGILEEGMLRENYHPHINIAKENSHIVTVGRKITAEDVNTLKREIEGTVHEINAALAEAGKGPLFDANALTSTFVRGARAIRAVRGHDFIEGALKQYGKTLNAFAAELGVKADDLAKNLPEGFVLWKGEGKLAKFGKHVLPADVADELRHIEKIYSGADDPGINAFLQMFDWASNKWKPMVTIRRPGFHVTNLLGNLWNMWLAGFRNPENLRRGFDVYNRTDGAVKTTVGTLSYRQIRELGEQHGALNTFIRNMFPTQLRDDLAATMKGKNILQKYDDMAREFGKGIEESTRFALFIDQMQKLKPAAELTGKAAIDDVARQAAEKVSKYLFDYGATTAFDQGVAKRLAPFWMWTKNNIPLQLQEMLEQPGTFNRFRDLKVSVEKQSDDPDGPRPAFLEEAIRMPFSTKDGAPLYYNPRLPLLDISRLSPGDMGREPLGMMNPVLKLPLQLMTGQNFFSGRPIERYPGQTQELWGSGVRVPVKAAFAAKEALGVVGQAGQSIHGVMPDADMADRLRLLRIFIPGWFSYDPEREQVNQAYQEVQRLQNLLRKYEDESGEKAPTVTELRKLGLVPKN